MRAPRRRWVGAGRWGSAAQSCATINTVTRTCGVLLLLRCGLTPLAFPYRQKALAAAKEETASVRDQGETELAGLRHAHTENISRVHGEMAEEALIAQKASAAAERIHVRVIS